MQPFEEKNQIQYVNADVVAEHFNVSSDTVIEWIKQRKISGKRSETNPSHYLVPKDEFDYLKNKRELDDTSKVMKELLGEEDWDVEIEE